MSALGLVLGLGLGGLVLRAADSKWRPALKPGPGVFFVAVDGKDTWSGTKPKANADTTDGPFQTLPAALEAARKFKQGGTGVTPTICVREGVYYLVQPLVLTSADSGISFEAYGREHPIISGGRRLTGWKPVTVAGKTLWAAEIPEARDGKWFFHELWVNGVRRTRARHPNSGYLAVSELPDKSVQWTDGQRRFRFRAGDLKNWPTSSNAEVVVMTKWVESRLPIQAVDETERIVMFRKRSVFQMEAGDLYYVENALEMLDTPGEWYLDPAQGMVYYQPMTGESPDRIEAIAPVLSQVVRIEGHPERGDFVAGVEFHGLAFAHCEWNLSRPGDPNAPTGWPAPTSEVGGFSQAAVGVPSAVWAEGARNCSFARCSFSHLGTYALELGRGCQSNRVSHCECVDLGAGGVRIGETAVRTNSNEIARANEIVDCDIHDGGYLFGSAIGVWIGQSPDNRLEHNTIHDFYYTGISIGWTWGYGPALASNNIVAFNQIHHIGVKTGGDGPILSDMGGIYTLGKQPGTRVLNNLWHDIAGLRYGGWGIYFDEGSSGIIAASNIVYRTTHGGFHQHYGETNIVRNNIFAFARDQQVQRSRDEDHISFSFSNNIVEFDTGALLGSTYKNDKFVFDHNVYWDLRPEAATVMKFAGGTLVQWRARGHDVHSVIADPLFVAPKLGDFKLRPASPALRMGFQEFQLNQVGPRN